MKFVSWNVNGLRACAGKGFADAFNSLDADFFCLQETKMQPGQLDMEFEGYKSYWNSAEKKGYSGMPMSKLFSQYDQQGSGALLVKSGEGMEVVRRGTEKGHTYHLLNTHRILSRGGVQGFQKDRLSQILAARRLTQVQLASMVDVSPATVSKWRAGTQAPERDALERLAGVVNVTPEWFTRAPGAKLSLPLFRSNASAHVANSLCSWAPIRSRSTPMNQRKAIPAKGTRFSASATFHDCPPSHSPGSRGCRRSVCRTSETATSSRTENRMPATAAALGVFKPPGVWRGNDTVLPWLENVLFYRIFFTRTGVQFARKRSRDCRN